MDTNTRNVCPWFYIYLFIFANSIDMEGILCCFRDKDWYCFQYWDNMVTPFLLMPLNYISRWALALLFINWHLKCISDFYYFESRWEFYEEYSDLICENGVLPGHSELGTQWRQWTTKGRGKEENCSR